MKTVWLIVVCLLLLPCSLVTADNTDEKFRLFSTKGREWKLHFFDGGQKLEDSVHYEVKSVRNDTCEVKKTVVTTDEKGKKKTKRDTFKFTMNEKYAGSWVSPPEGAKKVREEVLQVEAGKFDCIVYSIDGETHYMSKVYPGLLVKRIQPGYLDFILVEFKTFNDDPPATSEAAAPKQPLPEETSGEGGGRALGIRERWPSATPDFRLYKDKGRTWTIMERVNRSSKWEDAVEITHEITSVEDTAAKMKVTRRDLREKNGVSGETEEQVQFGPAGAKYTFIDRPLTFNYAVYPDRKIKVEAGVFDCRVVIAHRNRGRYIERNISYISKEYPGLLVYAEKLLGQQYELTRFERDKGDKGEGKETHEILSADKFVLPDGAYPAPEKKAEEPAAELNWTLYEKIGRKWVVKRTSIVAEKEQVSHTSYEVVDLGLDSCSLKTQAMNAKKKPLGDGNTIEIQFNEDNAFWCGPIANQEKTGEETIEAAGQKWECIVYTDTKSVKGATTTSWMSKKYPGLWIKMTTKGQYNDSTTELVEFSD